MHAEVWRSSLTWYKDSFEESFAWGRRRKEEAKKREAEEKMDVLQEMVRDARKATHNTPEVGVFLYASLRVHPPVVFMSSQCWNLGGGGGSVGDRVGGEARVIKAFVHRRPDAPRRVGPSCCRSKVKK